MSLCIAARWISIIFHVIMRIILSDICLSTFNNVNQSSDTTDDRKVIEESNSNCTSMLIQYEILWTSDTFDWWSIASLAWFISLTVVNSIWKRIYLLLLSNISTRTRFFISQVCARFLLVVYILPLIRHEVARRKNGMRKAYDLHVLLTPVLLHVHASDVFFVSINKYGLFHTSCFRFSVVSWILFHASIYSLILWISLSCRIIKRTIGRQYRAKQKWKQRHRRYLF
jgi:hypothetical protein